MSYPPGQGSEPPLDWPHYGIGFVAAIKRAYQKYATFSGRASRSEYWFFALYTGLVYLLFGIISVASTAGASRGGSAATAVDAAGSLASIPFILFFLASAVPSLAVGSRRLHDAGYSGALLLLNLIPYLGSFVVLIFTVMPTSSNAGRYGPPAPVDYGYPPYSGHPDSTYGRQNIDPGSYPQGDAQPYPYPYANPLPYGTDPSPAADQYLGYPSAYGSPQQSYPPQPPAGPQPGQPEWPQSPWQNPHQPDSASQDPR